jgi:hypothetical protein
MLANPPGVQAGMRESEELKVCQRKAKVAHDLVMAEGNWNKPPAVSCEALGDLAGPCGCPTGRAERHMGMDC